MPDVFVIIAGAIGAVAVSTRSVAVGVGIAFVVAHFFLFLFCNVLRMPRSLELAWAGLFVALAAGTGILGAPSWLLTFALSLAGTGVVTAAAIRRPSYHGIAWRRLNPRLPEWWQERGGRN